MMEMRVSGDASLSICRLPALLAWFIVLPLCFVRYATAGTTLASAVSYLISKNTYRFLKPRK
jgi:hypothetical protein